MFNIITIVIVIIAITFCSQRSIVYTCGSLESSSRLWASIQCWRTIVCLCETVPFPFLSLSLSDCFLNLLPLPSLPFSLLFLFLPASPFHPPLPSSYANKWPCHSSSLVGLEWMEVSFWKACSVWHSDRLRSRVLCTPLFSAQGSAYLVNDLQDCHWASSTPPTAEAAGLCPLEEADGGLGGVRWSCL